MRDAQYARRNQGMPARGTPRTAGGQPIFSCHIYEELLEYLCAERPVRSIQSFCRTRLADVVFSIRIDVMNVNQNIRINERFSAHAIRLGWP